MQMDPDFFGTMTMHASTPLCRLVDSGNDLQRLHSATVSSIEHSSNCKDLWKFHHLHLWPSREDRLRINCHLPGLFFFRMAPKGLMCTCIFGKFCGRDVCYSSLFDRYSVTTGGMGFSIFDYLECSVWDLH